MGIVESPYKVKPEAESEPTPTKEPTVSVRVWIPIAWKRDLDARCAARGVGLSVLLRLMIYDYLFPKNGDPNGNQ